MNRNIENQRVSDCLWQHRAIIYTLLLTFKLMIMKKGDKIVCINADNQVNDFEIYNRIKKGKIYKVRGITSVGGIKVNDFIHGYYNDGEEAGFNPDRFVKLSKMKRLKLI